MKTYVVVGVRSWVPGLVVALALAGTVIGYGAEGDVLARLDGALKAVATFEYGKDAKALREAESIVVGAAQNAGHRAAVESRLLGALSGPGSRDGQEFVCRQLMVVGTVRCIPQLEGLLADAGLAHVARYVLGSLEYSEAGAALRRGLGKTTGHLQIGIIGTLGERRDQGAVPVLAGLLGASDEGVARSVATALGKIGGGMALEALQRARGGAGGAVRLAVDGGLLRCADGLLATGEQGRAVEVYSALYSDASGALRVAALRGLVAARRAEATGLLVEAIRGKDWDLAVCAIGFSRSVEGTAMTRALAGLIPDVGPERQELVLIALGGRKDRAALDAVAAGTRSENQAVRLAAIEALGGVGDGSVVGLLLEVTGAAKAEEAAVARASLVRMESPDAGEALVKALGAGTVQDRVEVCRALAGRRAVAAVGALVGQAKSDDGAVRKAAIRALGDVSGESDLGVLVALLVDPKETGDRADIESAIESVFRRVAVPEKEAGPVLAGLGGARGEAKAGLIRLLGLTGTPAAFEAVRLGLKDGDADVREAAVRTLADWPDGRPAEDLLGLMSVLTQPALKAVAMRGYVRMAGLSKEATAMYVRALNASRRVDDKRLVLAGLGTTGSAEALELVEDCLGESGLEAEAGLAVVQIAERLRSKDEARVRAALGRVMAAVKDARVRQKALELLHELDRFKDHILVWTGAGPYKAEGLDTGGLMARAFPPEQPGGVGVEWKRIMHGVGTWEINLDQAMGGGDDVAGYARTRVWVAGAQECRIELGSDDAIKVWLNGVVVHSNVVHRGMGPRQDMAKGQLRAGWNDLQVKVVNRGGGWGFACRIRQPDGSAVDGLKVE